MQSCPPAGATEFDPDESNGENPSEGYVYLNLNERAKCNGTVRGWRYCFEPDKSLEQLILAMYRPQVNDTYQLVLESYYQLRQEDGTSFDSLTCRNITLQPSEYFTVQEGDVVAFCEEIDTSRVELFFSQNGNRVWRWNARECSKSRISFTDRRVRSVNDRVFLLSAFIGKICIFSADVMGDFSVVVSREICFADRIFY